MAQVELDLVFKTKGMKSLAQVNQEMNRAKAAADKAQNGIKKFERSSEQAKESVNRLTGSMTGLVAKLAAVAAATAGIGNSLNAAFERETAEKRLENLTGSAAEYEQAIRLATLASADFGVTQTEAAQALGDTYSRLQGVGFGLTEVNEIYRGFTTIARESGVAADEAAGAFLQLSQGLGAGALQGDELRSILERMPALAQRLAQSMGESANRVKQLGSEGKLTSEVIYKMLAESARGAENLTGKLTKQQATMATVKQRAEEMQVALGNALAPAFLAGMERLSEVAFITAKAFEAMNEWARKNEATIKRVLQIGLEVGKIAASVFIVVKAYQAYQKAVAAVAAAKATLIALTGVGVKVVIAAAAAGAAVYTGLTVAANSANDEIERLQGELGKSLDEIRQGAKNNEDLFRNQQQGVEDVTNALKRQIKAIDEQQRAASNAAQVQAMTNSVAGEELNTQLAIVEAKMQSAQQDLDSAKNAQERAKAAKQLYQLELEKADIEYEQAKLGISLALERVRLEKESAEQALKRTRIAEELAKAQGKWNESYRNAVILAEEALNLANQNLATAKQVAGEQLKQAKAVRDMKREAAGAAYEQNKVWKATEGAARSAGVFASNMSAAADSAERASAATRGLGKMQDDLIGRFGEAGKNLAFVEDFYQRTSEIDTNTSMLTYWRNYNAVVDDALTRAEEFNKVIRERNRLQAEQSWNATISSDPIPSRGDGSPYSSLGRAMDRYAPLGHRSSSSTAPQVNVQTGPVMRMNNQDYVTRQDLTSGINSAVNQTLKTLHRSPSIRQAAGI